ncbi:MAG: hypothetical protein IPL65_02385 [Lewinellaceae bacterium]|nr:hypothetical protein [Lewinellaceae bacterium]
MKDLQKLLHQQEHLKTNPSFIDVYEACADAQFALVESKLQKEAAEDAYQKAIDRKEKDEPVLLELLTALRQTKFMHLYHKAGYQLAKYKLEHFIDLHQPGTSVKPSRKKK